MVSGVNTPESEMVTKDKQKFQEELITYFP
jgi:hypothetical protein